MLLFLVSLSHSHVTSNVHLTCPIVSKKKKNDYQTPRRRVGKIHAEVQPSDVNETEGYRKQGRPTKRWDDDVNLCQRKVHRDNHNLTNDTTWLTAKQYGTPWKATL